MIKDHIKVTGKLRIQHFDRHGSLLREQGINNLVVTAGLNFIAARLVTAGLPTAMSHMAVGTDDTAAAVGQTALVTELGRVALGSSTPSTNTVQYQATFPAGTATGALVEAGIFNDVAAGTMLCRTVFPVVNKGVSDSIIITWTITVS